MNLREVFILSIIFTYFIVLLCRTQFPIFIDNQTMKEELGGIKLGRDINLIPLKDFMQMTSVLNIVMFVPIGFLLGLIEGIKWKKITMIGFSISFFIEISQILVNVFIGYNFRIADVNDLIFNTLGTIIGLFILYIVRYVINKLFRDDEVLWIRKIVFSSKK